MPFDDLKLGADEACIREAERQLGLRFSEELAAVYRVSNGLELPGGWELYPVFDPASPRKTANHLVYENTRGRWETMAAELVAVAGNGTGNQLVLVRTEDRLGSEIFVWDHERRRVKRWTKDLAAVLRLAEQRVEKIRRLRSGHGKR